MNNVANSNAILSFQVSVNWNNYKKNISNLLCNILAFQSRGYFKSIKTYEQRACFFHLSKILSAEKIFWQNISIKSFSHTSVINHALSPFSEKNFFFVSFNWNTSENALINKIRLLTFFFGAPECQFFSNRSFQLTVLFR